MHSSHSARALTLRVKAGLGLCERFRGTGYRMCMQFLCLKRFCNALVEMVPLKYFLLDSYHTGV